MKILISLIFVLSIIAAANAGAAIVGGKNAPQGKYPYLVSILENGGHFCGGSILNHRWILTAAHCLEGMTDPSTITIHAGSNSLGGPDGQRYQVEYFTWNRKFNRQVLNDDIALMAVNQDIEFNDRVKPINPPTSRFEDYGEVVPFAGWGSTGEVNGEWPGSQTLQEINVRIVDPVSCRRAWSTHGMEITYNQICTYRDSQDGLCFGDSGSPLVANGVQIGLFSFLVADDCAAGIPDVFTRVFEYRGWIREEIQRYENGR